MTVFRSAIFLLWFGLMTAVLAIVFLPVVILPWRATVWMARQWCRLTFWGLRVFAGLGYEVRGTPPRDGVLVASKHMSMWDTMALFLLLGGPAIIYKSELARVPFYGWFLASAGMIKIDREGRASALRKMAAEAKAALAHHRSILIFPEGHRQPPDAIPDYKPGVAGLYGQLDVACVPVALNSGLFWTGPGGFLKKRGRVVVQFLEPIPAGLRRQEFMTSLQTRIEDATAKLVVEGRASLAASG